MSPGTMELTARCTETGVCAASAQGSNVSHTWESRRTRPAPRAKGTGKLTPQGLRRLSSGSLRWGLSLGASRLGTARGSLLGGGGAGCARGDRSGARDSTCGRLSGARRAHVGAHRLGGPIRTLGLIGLPATPLVVARLARTLTLVARPARNVRTV